MRRRAAAAFGAARVAATAERRNVNYRQADRRRLTFGLPGRLKVKRSASER